ncbi:MAG: hypothetical protein GY772_19435 [bacterium]|nr:hypothetical protein [bacterium]
MRAYEAKVISDSFLIGHKVCDLGPALMEADPLLLAETRGGSGLASLSRCLAKSPANAFQCVCIISMGNDIATLTRSISDSAWARTWLALHKSLCSIAFNMRRGASSGVLVYGGSGAKWATGWAPGHTARYEFMSDHIRQLARGLGIPVITGAEQVEALRMRDSWHFDATATEMMPVPSNSRVS